MASVAPAPEPARHEPRLAAGRRRHLPKREYGAVFVAALKKSRHDQITNSAAAIAYYLFAAIPAMLLIAVGVFSIFAGPAEIQTIIQKVGTVAPPEAVSLLERSLRRTAAGGGGLAMIVVGGGVGLWTVTGAMTAVMRALDSAYDRKETRGFVRQRLAALLMMFFALLALVLVSGLLVLGPKLSAWVGSALGMQSLLSWIWWTAQWPILIAGLLFSFAVILFLGPNIEHRTWRFMSFGAVVAVVVWLLTSAVFAFFVSHFGSYNKTWGSLAAVIILLTWLWLSALSLLFAGEVNAELDRRRDPPRAISLTPGTAPSSS